MEQIIKNIEQIIDKYLNVNRIGTEYDEEKEEVKIDLYDYLDKPGNFEEHVENILYEIDTTISTKYTFSHKYYYDTYWDGDNDVKSYNCEIKIKKQKELCEVRNNLDICRRCKFCKKGEI